MAEYELFKTLLENCFEKYEKVRKLLEKKDPEEEPYKSKYEAKEMLSSIKKELTNYEDSRSTRCQENDNEMIIRTKCITAAVYYKLGLISIETEELSSGEEHLVKCLDLVEDRELSRDCILVVLQTLNQIGILWSMRGELQKALDFLKRAENLSKKYRKEVCVAPLDIEDLFFWKRETEEEQFEANWKVFEKTLTHTMYYLAQVYTNLEESVRAAEYCHTTLRRQLETRDFDPLDWAINSATLSQFFVGCDDFEDARHHLACATYVLDNYESELKQQEAKTDGYDKLLDTLRHRRADVARCWAKYGLILLSMSWDNLMQQTVEEMVEDLNQVAVSDQTQAGQTDPNETSHDLEQDAVVSFSKKSSGKSRMVFKSLEVTTLEEQLPTKYVMDFEQARSVFLNTQKWQNQAKEYYTLSDHASDHVQLVQDTSKLYKLLAYFEPVEERQCKMHKRRIDMMEAVLKELNPQYYLIAVRQLQFELAETYSQILDLKLVISQDPMCGTRSLRYIKKVNHLAEEGIKCFQAFIDTFKDPLGKMPETYPEELVRPVLLAHFYIGRFHSKMISDNSEVTIENLKKSYHMYKFLVDYCDKHPVAAEAFKDEIGVTKEMVQLLPIKMDKFTAIAGV